MITIVDYGAGNLTSVKRSLDHLGIPNRISSDPGDILSADQIIFPGVGHAASAMQVLHESGLDSALKTAFHKGIPMLGICIGCQIILTHSEEGNTLCLDLIPGDCLRFRFRNTGLKIPHMGWNVVTPLRRHPVLAHLHDGEEFYFVHSYYPRPFEPETVYAACDYGGSFPVAIGLSNLFAVQFHAEKSGPVGLQVLRNFSEWNGEVGS
jgi:glutamine amidotransferase